MLPEDRALTVGASCAAVGVLIALLLQIWIVYVFFFGGMAAAAILLGVIFLPKYPLGFVKGAPGDILAFLARRLRLEEYRVEQAPGRLTIRLGSLRAVRLFVRPAQRGCEVRYQPYATPSGWGTLVFLTVLGWTSLLAIPVIVYAFHGARSFARGELAGILPREAVPAEAAPDEVRALLLESLSEAHRFAAEAHEETLSTYRDLQAIVVVVAFTAWLLLFIMLALALPEPYFVPRLGASALFAAGIVLAATVPGLIACRARFRPRILRYRAWAMRLAEAMHREATRAMPAEDGSSVFELLSEAALEVPLWIEAARRGGINRDPSAGILLVMTILSSVSVASAAVSGLWLNLLVGVGLLAAGVGGLVAALLFYRRWKHRWNAETVRIEADWKLRLDGVRGQMEQYLQDL